jgi:D-alanyl-D-alanine carboxypeptidase (penicillin-binding protein 5/6)
MFQPARRLFTALLAAVLSLASASVVLHGGEAVAQSPATQPKYAAIVIDAHSGEVLYAQRADSARYPASITKVMTMYLAFEALEQGRLKPSDTIVISPRAAAQQPSKLGLRVGDTITVDQAIRAVAVKSANDIAVALAEKIGGTEARFAALMTLRAQELGMTHTRFVNANGLPDSRQLSSARDIALLSRAVMRDYPQYYSYFGQRYFEFRGQSMRNHNGLLHRMPGVDGLKTGFTNASGFNLAASAVRDGRRLIAVVLGGASTASRDNHVQELLTAGFDVMRMRANGEHVQLASLLPETSQTRYALVGSVEQGSSEPTYVVPRARSASAFSLIDERPDYSVSDAPKPAAPKKAAAPVKLASLTSAKKSTAEQNDDAIAERLEKAKDAKADAKKDAKDAKDAKDGDWVVQVGAFKTSSDAKERLGAVAKKYAAHFKRRDGDIVEGGGAYSYRVRFEGYDADAAKAACKALAGKGGPCLAMRGG